MSSRPSFSMWRNHSWRFNASPDGERQILPSEHARLTHNHQPRHNSETELRSDEPEPVDMAREQWIQQPENGVEQSRPQHGSDESSKDYRPVRKHGKHGAIQQSHQ